MLCVAKKFMEKHYFYVHVGRMAILALLNLIKKVINIFSKHLFCKLGKNYLYFQQVVFKQVILFFRKKNPKNYTLYTRLINDNFVFLNYKYLDIHISSISVDDFLLGSQNVF